MKIMILTQTLSNKNEDLLLSLYKHSSSLTLYKQIKIKFLLRVFIGGHAGVQNTFFTAACKSFSQIQNATVELITTDQLKTLHWSPKQLKNWIVYSNMHLFLTH